MMFMLAGPGCARVVGEFEAIHDLPPSSTGHHEKGRSLQATFRKDIIIIFCEGSRAAWQPFRCNKSGAGSTRYSERRGRVRCGITF